MDSQYGYFILSTLLDAIVYTLPLPDTSWAVSDGILQRTYLQRLLKALRIQ